MFNKKKENKIDFLGVVAESIKAVPGSGFLLNPLIKIREDNKNAERNAAIDAMFTEGRELTQNSLANIIELKDQSNESQILLNLMLIMIKEIWESHKNNKHVRPLNEVMEEKSDFTKFPIPIQKNILLKELLNLYEKNPNDFKRCLDLTEYPYNVVLKNPYQLINEFKNSIIGKKKETLAEVFQNLSNDKPGSKILSFSAKNLANP